MRTSLVALLVALLSSVAGCAADQVDAQAPDEEIESDEAALSSMSYYDCRGSFSDDVLTRMEVGLSKTRLSLTDLSKEAVVPDMGKLDKTYNPSPSYAGAIRFLGFDKIVDSWRSDANHMEIVVSKELKAKASQGKLWIRTTGGGGGSTSYFCKAKPAKLKVVTATKARLACSLDKLSCVDDNPPGSTCLADLFINQTDADSATLKLTYLDHFGVHVVERKPSLGASTELTRSTTKAGGEWSDASGDWKLKLDYRAGISYTGTFQLPNGQKNAVTCNDLAMLD